MIKKKDKKFYIIFVFFLSITFLVVSLYVFNESILKKTNLGLLKTLTTLFFPPDDLYRPLASEAIDSLEIDRSTTLNFKNKYSGKHRIAISIERDKDGFDLLGNTLESTFKLDFYNEEDFLLLSKTSESNWPYLGVKDLGYVFMTYDVPYDLPLNLAIKCEVTILEINSELNNSDKKFNFVISKMSDL